MPKIYNGEDCVGCGGEVAYGSSISKLRKKICRVGKDFCNKIEEIKTD